MQEHFNRGATDQDLIEARDARGYTILHVLVEKIALTRNSSELMPLFVTVHSIAWPVKEQINQALAKKGTTFKKDCESLFKQIMSDTSPKVAENIDANCVLLGLYQQHIRCQNENNNLKLQLSVLEKYFVNLATVASGIIGGMTCWIILDKYFP